MKCSVVVCDNNWVLGTINAANQLETSSIPQFIIHPYFRNVVVPLVTLFLTIYFRVTSRKTEEITRADFLVGVDLCITSLLIFSIGMIDRIRYPLDSLPYVAIQKLLDDGVLSETTVASINSALADQIEVIDEKVYLSWMVLLLMFVYTSVMAFATRKFGWGSDNQPKVLGAIVFPNILGVFILIFSAWWISL